MEPLPNRLNLEEGMDAFNETRLAGGMRGEELSGDPNEFLKLGDGDLAEDRADGGRD